MVSELEAAAMALDPKITAYLRSLGQRLDAAARGEATTIVNEAAKFLDWKPSTVYRQLKCAVGWSALKANGQARKPRSDKGSTSVCPNALTVLGATQREAVRENGKQTLHTPAARGMLEQNGYAFGVSNGQLNSLMRDRRLNVPAQQVARPVQALRAPYPNHTHEVDPSLCLVYYLHGHQYIIRDDQLYKNKLDKLHDVKFKCWRYVLYDKASGALVPWYVEAAGETQHNLFEFLLFAWGQQPGRLFQGVPKFLLWDKGSANQAAAVKNALVSLGVTDLTHQAGNARAKGGVENGNNLVETQFESRLRFQPVADVAALNAAAQAWANSYNANLIPGQDTRLRRPGLAVPTARYDLWQLINAAAGELRTLPPPEVCRAMMSAKAEDRKVKPDLSITFKHPQAERTAVYMLRGLPGINVGDTVQARALVYGDCAVQVQVPRYDGELLTYRVEPERAYDAFGQHLDAAEIGFEYKRTTKTDAEAVATTMDALAYPGLNVDEVTAARQKRATPFEGKLVSHGYLQDVAQPAYLQRPGTVIATPAHLTPQVELLDATAAMLRLAQDIGRFLTADEHAFLSARYADGVPEDQIKTLVAQFTAPLGPIPIRAAGGLRVVGGGV
jgi:hypothetical protein